MTDVTLYMPLVDLTHMSKFDFTYIRFTESFRKPVMPKKRLAGSSSRGYKRRRTGRSRSRPSRSVYRHYKSHGYSNRASRGMRNRTMAIQRAVFTNNYKLIAFTVDYTFHFSYSSGSTLPSKYAWVLAFNGNGMLRPFEDAQSYYTHWTMREQATGSAGDPGRPVEGFNRWIGGTGITATAPYQKYVVKGAKLTANLTPMGRNGSYPGSEVHDSAFSQHNALCCVPTTDMDKTHFNSSLNDWQNKRGIIQNNVCMVATPSNAAVVNGQQAKITSAISPKKMLGAADLRDDPLNHGTVIDDPSQTVGWFLSLQMRTPKDVTKSYIADHILRVKIDYTALCFDPTEFNSGEILGN